MGRKMFGIDFKDSLLTYEDITNFQNLRTCLEDAVKDTRTKIKFLSFISDKNPIEIFESDNSIEWEEGLFNLEIKKSNHFHEIKLKRTIVRSDIPGGRREVEGSFCLFKSKAPKVWTMFTGEPGQDFFSLGMESLVDYYKPEFSNFFVSSGEMRGLFDHLEESLDCELIAEKAIIYTHDKEGSISFKTRPYHVVFNEAENENMYVDKVEFIMRKDREIVLHAFISRNGESKYIGGKEIYFFDHVLPLFEEIGTAKGKLLEGKERELGSKILNPVNIYYDKNVFGSKEDNMRLIEVISQLPKSIITVYHKNPYLHLSLLDYVDGSNFDIFVTSPDTISVIPSFRASRYSFMRLCNIIADRFSEGEIKEREKQQFEFNDFFEA